MLKIGDPTENVRAVRAYDLLPEVDSCSWWVTPFRSSRSSSGSAWCWASSPGGSRCCLGADARRVHRRHLRPRGLAGSRSSAAASAVAGDRRRARPASTRGSSPATSGLLLLSAYLIWRPRTPFSVDERLLPDRRRPLRRQRARPTGRGTARRPRAGSRQQAAEIRRAAAAQEQRRGTRTWTVAVLPRCSRSSASGTRSSRTATSPGRSLAPRERAGRRLRDAGRLDAARRSTVDVYEDFMCPFCGAVRGDQPDATSTRPPVTGAVPLPHHRVPRPGLVRPSTPREPPTRSPSCSTRQVRRWPRSSTTSSTRSSPRRAAPGSATPSWSSSPWRPAPTQSEVEKPHQGPGVRGHGCANATDAASKARGEPDADRARRRPARGRSHHRPT